ncbi:MAG: TSUP family transporter, partial [Proteobacteria bacterium]|nr:TSUP family transporter [Pseudomonadota bacterium]
MIIPADILGWDLLIAALIATIAGLTKGYAGFGGGMIMAPLLAFIYGPAQAVAMIMVLEFLASIQLFPRAVRLTEWRLIGPLA